MATPTEAIETLGLTVTSVFVPFSQSRHKNETTEGGRPRFDLNWRVTVACRGRVVLETDYSAGCGHCPGYKANKAPHTFQPSDYRRAGGEPFPGTTSNYRRATPGEALTQYREAIAAAECESGFPMEIDPYGRGPRNLFKRKAKSAAIEPKAEDVLYSLVSDSDVLNSSGFEDWASNYGYETDSRSAEATYRACLELALKMRAAIGETGLSDLQTAFQDY